MCEHEQEYRKWLQGQLELVERGEVVMEDLTLQVRASTRDHLTLCEQGEQGNRS